MKKLSFVIPAVLAVACADVTGPLSSLAGTWNGYYISAINTLNLTLEQRGDSVSGIGILAPDNWSLQRFETLSVVGTYSRPMATLDFAPFGGGVFHFTGTVVGHRLAGDDGQADSMVFQRR